MEKKRITIYKTLDEPHKHQLEKGLEPQVFGLNNYIDILTYVHRRFSFEECYQRSRTCRNDLGNLIHFFHLNDLREQKIIAHRLQDLRDVVMIDEFIVEAKKQGDALTD